MTFRRAALAIMLGILSVERGPSMLWGMPAHASVNMAQEAHAIQSCINAGETPEACGELAPMDSH